MNTSVSTRTSATVPLIPTWRRRIRRRAERSREHRFHIRGLPLEVIVEGAPDDFRQGDSLGPGQDVNALALFLGQVDLRSGAGHTAQYTAALRASVIRAIGRTRFRCASRSGCRCEHRRSQPGCDHGRSGNASVVRLRRTMPVGDRRSAAARAWRGAALRCCWAVRALGFTPPRRGGRRWPRAPRRCPRRSGSGPRRRLPRSPASLRRSRAGSHRAGPGRPGFRGR